MKRCHPRGLRPAGERTSSAASNQIVRRGMMAAETLLLVFLTACSPTKEAAPDHTEELYAGFTMGTEYHVKVVFSSGIARPEPAGLAQTIQEKLNEIDGKMSTYREDSELSRFNAFAETTPFKVSSETIEVFQRAARVSEASGGAFDVTVGPLVNAWGFGPDGMPAKAPTDDELVALRARVGYRLVELDPKASTLRKTRPDVSCDLAAIAKGYGVDAVSLALDQLGCTDYMVEVGGEVRVRGRNVHGLPWQVAIEKPLAAERRVVESVVPMVDCAMATSGDYRNFYERDGERLSHTIDPRTGRPIQHRLASASIIHEECAIADAYATACMALGVEEALALAEKEKLVAVFLVHDAATGFSRVTTSRFGEFIDQINSSAGTLEENPS